AKPLYRTDPSDIGLFYVRNANGDMVPLSTVVDLRKSSGPEFVTRFNEYRGVEIFAVPAPGYSTGQAMAAVAAVADQVLPRDMGYAWNGMSYQESIAGSGLGVFALSLILVFLILAALYQSWSLPFSVLLSTPVAVVGAFVGLWMRRLDNNVYAQIGLIMLIGLSAKNAILIVEYAKAELEKGASLVDAALNGARRRLRPILMTSFAFIFGLMPLWNALGAGAVARRLIGPVTITGMLFSTGGGGLVRGPPVVAGVRRPDPPGPRARGARGQLRAPERRRAHRGGTGAGRRRRLGPLSARRISGVGGAPEDLFHPDLSQHDIQYLPGGAQRGMGDRRLGPHPPRDRGRTRAVPGHRGGPPGCRGDPRERRGDELFHAPRARSRACDRARQRGDLSAHARRLHAAVRRRYGHQDLDVACRGKPAVEHREHRCERERTPLPGGPADRVVPGAAGVLGRDDRPVPRDDRRGVPRGRGRAGGGSAARRAADGAGGAGGRAPGRRAAVARAVRDGPVELHRGAGR